MPKQRIAGAPPQVSAIWARSGIGGACQHLRMVAPFSWLRRHEGWRSLDFALKGGTPRQRLARRLCAAAEAATGRAYPCLRAGVPDGWILAPAPAADALLVCRETTAALCEEALATARQRHIPLVYDTDDLLLALPDDSPLADRYRAMRPLLTGLARAADQITVSTPALAAELAELNPCVSVLPNFIDLDLWGVSQVAPPDDQPLSIGFWGSSTHMPELQRLTEGLRHLKTRYGRRVRFCFLGCHDPGLLSLEDVTVGGYVDSYAAYAAATRACRLDIAMAPLAINRFNRCKSAIKFFEYSIRGACGIYTDIEPYQAVVRQGQNGLLVGPNRDEWVGALERLIDDPALRYHLACQAQADVLAHHTLDQHACRWRQTYEMATRRSASRPAARMSGELPLRRR